jgi:hypothetical protein
MFRHFRATHKNTVTVQSRCAQSPAYRHFLSIPTRTIVKPIRCYREVLAYLVTFQTSGLHRTVLLLGNADLVSGDLQQIIENMTQTRMELNIQVVKLCIGLDCRKT